MKYIFTDFFDTIIFRRVHSYQISSQWAKALKYKYPCLMEFSDDDLIAFLDGSRRSLYKDFEEPPYNKVLGLVWEHLPVLHSYVDKESFVNQSLAIDVAIELGCQYPNMHLINKFREYKKIYGSKIYIVSDFYLPATVYNDFLVQAGIEDLFDDVYVSETCNCTKHKGGLYDYVLKDLSVDAKDVTMFGDSKHSDVLMARQHGIRAKHYFPLWHKIGTNISRIRKTDFAKHIVKWKSSWCYKNSLFEEYAVILYTFNTRLDKRLQEFHASKSSFLSRGGYFPYKVFNAVSELINNTSPVVEYCYNSRKTCFAARESKQENGDAFRYMKQYMEDFLADDGKLYIVDEGWYNHSQQAMGETFNWDIVGLYIGSRFKDKWNYPSLCHREGLLFDYKGNGDKSPYYDVLCTNCSMYEQMLTAPHGSVASYHKNEDGEIKPVLKENGLETEIYNMYIEQMQNRMLLHIKGLSVWLLGCDVSNRTLAKIILKSSVFANAKRCQFLNDLDAHRYDNCSTGAVAADKGVKDVRINPFKLICNPAEYLGMFCKLQRKLLRIKPLFYLYYPFAACYFGYVYFITFFIKRK